ncbi:MAG: response regulator transcription factor [Gammaproteobacteria bacterium]
MIAKQILLVDDDVALGELLTDYLAKFGFTLTVKHHPKEGLAALNKGNFAAAIFDVMLPEMDGFTLCKRARRTHPRLPILMLTARGDITDLVVGLEIGADDYMPKPFEPRELSARLTALLRRATPPNANDEALCFDGIKIHLPARRVWLADHKEVALTAVEFRVLSELVQQRPAVIDRDYLIEKIRGFERDIYDRSIDIAISRLRTKLGDSPQHPKFIQTMRGEGYAFIAAPLA